MSLNNTNTNNNLICETGASFQGFIFDGSANNPSMSIVKGADTLLEFSLKDVFMPVDQWVSRDFNVKANSNTFIDGDNIQDTFGEVQFIALLVTYPEIDVNKIIVETQEKYIKFQYPQFGASTYNLGKIMMLSGTTKPGSGWGFNESPGGITLINPHLGFDVRVKMLAFA
jgi:hypothetical protein